MAEYNPSKIIKDGNTYNFRDTTKIPLSGSNAISGDLIPSTDGTVNFGSSSYQWNNAYIKSLTINGVACGDILTHNASEFVDISSNQTVGGNKEFTGTTTAHDLVPSATDTYNLGSTSYQWNNLYAKNYYYNGVAWGLDQANVWTGRQTYGAYLKSFGEERADDWSGNSRTNAYLLSRRDTEDVSGFLINTFRSNVAQGTAMHIYGWDILENSTRYSGLRFAVGWDSTLNSGNGAYRVTLGTNTQGANPCNDLHITQLKTINGINPGALSLPKTEDGRYSLTELSSIPGINVDNWALDGSKIVIDANYVITGWLYVCIACDTDGYVILQTGGYSYPNCFYKVTGTPIAGYASAMIPIVEGIALTLYLKGTSLIHARYYPAAGNV